MKKFVSKPVTVEKVIEKVVATEDCVVEEADGLEVLLGKQVLVFCMVYIYSGKLVGVNSTCIKLENAHMVFETGSFDAKTYKDAQKLPSSNFYVSINSIESFGLARE